MGANTINCPMSNPKAAETPRKGEIKITWKNKRSWQRERKGKRNMVGL